jgi:hypothetical protein
MHRRSPGYTGIVVFCLVCGLVQAQQARGEGPDQQSREVAAPLPNRPLVHIEPGPEQRCTLYADGPDGPVFSTPTHIVSRLMCGSDPTGVTVDDLKRIAHAARAASENIEMPMDIRGVPTGDGGPGGGGPRDGGGPRSLLNITFAHGSLPPGADAALDNVELYIENMFEDPISLQINVVFSPLGSGILGQTNNSYPGPVTWQNTRIGLINDMDPDDSIQDWLPAGSTIPVRYNGLSGTATNENRCYFSVAAYRAAIGTVSGIAATMTFNSDFSWDYDPSNGISGGSHCFQSVVAHEVAHALGFISGADFRTNDIEPLDIYRFQQSAYNPTTPAQFQTTARLVDNGVPNNDHISNIFPNPDCDDTDIEYWMSDGDPAQASHFRQGVVYAVMQPSLSAGATFYPDFYKQPDLDMLDAIGWDYAPEPGTTDAPFFDDFPTWDIDCTVWTGLQGAEVSTAAYTEPSFPFSLNLAGSASGGESIRTARIDTSAQPDVLLEYYYQRKGSGDSPEPGEDLVIEYYNSSQQWIEITRHLGSGSGMGTFILESHTLTASDARHTDFRVQFRAISSSPELDDWFIDDVFIWDTVDHYPPEPSPMEWESEPAPFSTSEITMTAVEASDESPPVSYFFLFSGSDGSGGSSSGSWQPSRIYVDGGLDTNTVYSYKVAAVDDLGNAGDYSFPAAPGATDIETPIGISFAGVDDTSMDVTAEGIFTNLTGDQTGQPPNQSGIFFEMTPAGGSGANAWVTTETISVTGLTPGTEYTFNVRARNYFADETPPFGPVSQSTTGGVPCTLGDVNQDGSVNGLDVGGFVRAKLGLPPEPGENPACAEYGGTLQEDIDAFIADLLNS